MSNRSGHSMVEVLVAGMVLLTAVVPAAAALGHSVRWGVRGRARTTVAIAAADRLERLRVVAQSTTPACLALSAGSAATTKWSEDWTVEPVDSDRLVTVIASVELPTGPVSDTLEVTIRCH